MKIGLFFGSFNPIHIGHLIIANFMAENSDLEKVWFIVTPQNPFKKDTQNLLHDFDRLDMVRAACFENENFDVKDIEFHLPKPNYTANTLIQLQEKYPDNTFSLIIGEDNLASFHKWKNYEAILENYSLKVFPREGSKPTELKKHKNVEVVESPLLNISATFIRKCLKEGKSIKYLVAPEVEQFILDKGFYQN